MRILDRYVLRSWVVIFVLTSLGFPVVSVLINMTDNLERLLARGLKLPEIVVSYFYALPETASMIMPAAVLFATVFTVGNLGRHSELTAAKAGGWSFYRLTLPIFVAATLASGLAFEVGELAPESTSRQLELQKAKLAKPRTARYNFVFRADQGWVYTIRSLDVQNRMLRQLVFERQGKGPDYPDLALSADSASYVDSLRTWRLWSGSSRRMFDRSTQVSLRFRSARLKALSQEPVDLLAEPKAPEEMRYAELTRYIEALKRSGQRHQQDRGRPRAEDRAAGHLSRHRAVRRAARRLLPAPGHRHRDRDQPRHHGALPLADPALQGGRRDRHRQSRRRRVGTERPLSRRGALAVVPGADVTR